MNCATALPSTNATVYGIERRLKEAASSGLVSEFTFTSFHRPPYSRSRRSSNGPSTLQGPHHGAQKSTSTGTSIEDSITSRSNEDRVASIIAFPRVPAGLTWREKTKFNNALRNAVRANPSGL